MTAIETATHLLQQCFNAKSFDSVLWGVAGDACEDAGDEPAEAFCRWVAMNNPHPWGGGSWWMGGGKQVGLENEESRLPPQLFVAMDGKSTPSKDGTAYVSVAEDPDRYSRLYVVWRKAYAAGFRPDKKEQPVEVA